MKVQLPHGQYSRKATVTSIESSESSDSSSIAITVICSPGLNAATSSAPSSIRHCATDANERRSLPSPDGEPKLSHLLSHPDGQRDWPGRSPLNGDGHRTTVA